MWLQANDLRRACAGVTSSEALKKLLTYVLRLSKELDDRKYASQEHGPPAPTQVGGHQSFGPETSALDYVVRIDGGERRRGYFTCV